ncbi:VOC family protein [Leptospira langatensis]|uniref:VOC family protein n=1 Tax=Leptospira langatensis TaxID=2484983 RepID=A0A5F1ZTE2_9LEPT|nr:VOC family protein [Leptospira langatensis]TGK02945.1 VOC family protein [Leptospira langatensis]TGL41700.1 VOC family protein [Leptospira langatensis]
MFVEVNHIGIVSRDPEVSANFYRGIFDLSETGESSRAVETLGIGKANLAIYGEKKDMKTPVFSSGCDFAFRVDPESFHRIEEKLFAQRMEYDVRKTERTLFLTFQDPDGYVLELICDED